MVIVHLKPLPLAPGRVSHHPVGTTSLAAAGIREQADVDDSAFMFQGKTHQSFRLKAQILPQAHRRAGLGLGCRARREQVQGRFFPIANG